MRPTMQAPPMTEEDLHDAVLLAITQALTSETGPDGRPTPAAVGRAQAIAHFLETAPDGALADEPDRPTGTGRMPIPARTETPTPARPTPRPGMPAAAVAPLPHEPHDEDFTGGQPPTLVDDGHDEPDETPYGYARRPAPRPVPTGSRGRDPMSLLRVPTVDDRQRQALQYEQETTARIDALCAEAEARGSRNVSQLRAALVEQYARLRP